MESKPFTSLFHQFSGPLFINKYERENLQRLLQEQLFKDQAFKDSIMKN